MNCHDKKLLSFVQRSPVRPLLRGPFYAGTIKIQVLLAQILRTFIPRRRRQIYKCKRCVRPLLTDYAILSGRRQR